LCSILSSGNHVSSLSYTKTRFFSVHFSHVLNNTNSWVFCSRRPRVENTKQNTENKHTLQLDSNYIHRSNCFNIWIEYFQVHGVLNAVSWGTLMPLGAMIARYLKVFKSANPAWFYLHVACQTSAYAIGVAGWATGLKLGSEGSSVSQYDTHRNIGITLFCLGTLQVLHIFIL